jgi:hypothetical protein
MTQQNDLIDLATKLEALKEPCRDMDAEIAVALGHKIKMVTANYTMELYPAIEWQKPHPYAGMQEPCPCWTASIDVALSLVGAGERVDMNREGHGDRSAYACVWGKYGNRSVRAATLPIALIAAALRAQAPAFAANGVGDKS